MRESVLVFSIIKGLYGVVKLMRANVGTVTTVDGKKFSTGLPRGFPDIFGVLPPEHSKTGQPVPVFIECKVGYNKPSPEQAAFLEKYRDMGCWAGAVWSVSGAWDLLIPFLDIKCINAEGGVENGGETDVCAEDRPVGAVSEPIEDGEAAVL